MGAFSQNEMGYLKEQQLGRLATVSKKLIPQVTPVLFGVNEDHMYLNIKHTSKKGTSGELA